MSEFEFLNIFDGYLTDNLKMTPIFVYKTEVTTETYLRPIKNALNFGIILVKY